MCSAKDKKKQRMRKKEEKTKNDTERTSEWERGCREEEFKLKRSKTASTNEYNISNLEHVRHFPGHTNFGIGHICNVIIHVYVESTSLNVNYSQYYYNIEICSIQSYLLYPRGNVARGV